MWPFAKILLFVIIALAPCGAESDLAVVGPPAGEQTLAIIVNQSNPVENFSYEDLRKIFLGERSHWPNGRRITLVMLEASLERKVVLRDIYGMSEKDFDNHFIQGVFTGSVFVSPKTLANPADVLKFVFNVPGAIGYVRASDVDSSVKVLRVDGRLPEDKDYRFRLGTPRVTINGWGSSRLGN
jgi:ABC-type phosphate transport system substrate-binding protein